ncbi:MAG: hypothetical protein J1F37_00475 [Oscillospiraceae bacterium]|nr:hypothetical protein [Oscillospiraceae bacterium]
MAKKEKSFNLKLYAVIVFFAVAAALTLMVIFTFNSKYTAFHPEEVARNYADTIVQTGDGYNAYKTTLVSKSQKYGDFIRKYYMYPIIYRDAGYKPGDDTKKLKELKGLNDKSFMSDASKNDDGTLQGQVIDKMYDYYVELVANGWDNYDEFFTKYFEQLASVRKDIFGDYYMTDEIMFTALESNVATYGKSLTGTEDEFDKNTKKQTSFKSIGEYEKVYGEDYRFTASVAGEKDIDLASYKAAINADTFAKYGVSADDITDVKCYTVEIKTDDGKVVTSTDVTVAKIGSSWYVDSAATDTTALYSFYK